MNPSHKTHPLPAFVGFVLMAVLGWNMEGDTGKSASVAAGEPPVTRASRSRTAGPRQLPAEVERRLAPLRAARNEAERMHAAIGLASTIPASEIAAWLDGGWFSQRKGASGTLFHKILLERWKQEDPAAFVAWSLQNRPGDAYNLLLSTAAADPQSALDFFKANPNPGAELRLLADLAKAHPDIALRRLQEMAGEISSRGSGYLTDNLLAEIAKQSPAGLAAALDSLPAGLKRDAERHLMDQQMAADFSGGLKNLQDHPDGLNLFTEILNRNASLQEKLPAELAGLPDSWKALIAKEPHAFVRGKNPEAWFEVDLEAAGFTRKQADEIRTEAMGPLLEKHPEDALRRLAEMDLPEQTRSNLIWNALRVLRGQPEKAAEFLALLDNEEDRSTANRALDTITVPAIEQPAEWLEKVAGRDLSKEWPAGYLSMLETWDQEKIAALRRQFGSLPDASKRPLARILSLAGGLDDSLRGQAIHYLVSNPSDEPSPPNPDPFAESEDPDPAIRSIQLASNHIRGMAGSDPDGAGQWIATLPEGDARWWASKNLHSLWSGYDPEAADRWLKSLPEDEQNKIRQIRKK